MCFANRPTTVEVILSRHPDVLEVALVAVPDPVLGEKPHAYIYSDGAGIDAGELKDLCAGFLSSYKVPDQICVSETPLPRNADGKILKTELRSLSVAASVTQ
jgi:non-ribosomal peptide synthetase component E (peptide arylation enzyme)